MQKQNKILFWPGAIVFVVSLFLFAIGSYDHEIIGFESRFYLFALEMWRHGPNFFPTTYHTLYPDYPATSTLGIYLFAKGLQQLNPLAAILPSAIAAAFTMLATYLIGARHSIRWGIIACCWLILTFTFFKSARTISLDIFPACFTAWCFYLLPKNNQRFRLLEMVPIFILMICSFFCRGPIGFVMPAGVICSFYLVNRDIKTGFKFALAAVVLLSTLTAGLLALAYHLGGAPFMQSVLNMEIVGRMEGAPVPIYYYFLNGLTDYALTFPIAAIMLIMSLQNRQRIPRMLWQLFAWVAVILIGMSIPADKKMRYVLVIAPALALLVAYPFANLNTSNYFASLKNWVLRFICGLPTLYLLGLGGLFYYVNLYVPDIPTRFSLLTITIVIAQIINLVIWFRYRKNNVALFTVAAFLFAFTYINMVEPIFIHFEKSKDFVENIETLRSKAKARLVFYQERPDGLAIKYLIHMSKDEAPYFLGNEDELLDYSKRAFFISSEDNFAALAPSTVSKLKVIDTGTIGHKHVVIFKFK